MAKRDALQDLLDGKHDCPYCGKAIGHIEDYFAGELGFLDAVDTNCPHCAKRIRINPEILCEVSEVKSTVGFGYISFRDQTIECERRGNRVTLDCSCGLGIVVCLKYKTRCTSKVCFSNRNKGIDPLE